MATKKMEELTRDELWEELGTWNQLVSRSKAELLQRLTDSLEREGINPNM